MPTESFTAANNTDITGVGSSIWAYSNGSSGDLFVTSNEARPRVNNNNLTGARRAGTFTDDQYAQIVLRTLVSQSRIGVIVRGNTSGTFYCLYASSNEYWLIKFVSYSFTLLRYGAKAFSSGDVLRLEASGTTLTCKQNGTTFWTSVDASIASGNPGVSCNGENAASFSSADDWDGGDLAALTITDVDTDEIVTANQTGVVISGSGFGSSQGSGNVEIVQGAVTVQQTINFWSATSIQFDMVFDTALSQDLKHGAATLRVTANDASTSTIAITINPPTGQVYVDLTSVYT